MYRWLLKVFLLVPFIWGVPTTAAELVYFGSATCSVCERWEEEVGHIYPKTAEASVLPLRHQDIHDTRPEELKFVRGIVYTPTFVAIDNGQEIGRIVGYMGDFFFWEQMDHLVQKTAHNKAGNKSACGGNVPTSKTTPC